MMSRMKSLQIEMGSAFITVYSDDGEVVLKEPSIVLIDKNSKKVIGVGKEAEQKLGKMSGSIDVFNPMKQGFFIDRDIAKEVLMYVIKKTDKNKIFKPKLIITMPNNSSIYYYNVFYDICDQIGVRNLSFQNSLLFSAKKAGVDILKDNVNMLIDIGASITKVGVIFSGKLIKYSYFRIASNDFDRVIVDYVRNQYGLEISKKTAEDIKINIGMVYVQNKSLEYKVRARNINTGIPDSVLITSEELYQVLNDVAISIVENIAGVFAELSVESIEDLIDNGIYLIGGGSRISGFEELLTEKLNVKVIRNM